MKRVKIAWMIAALLGAAPLTAQGAAAATADFFKGKRMTYIVATNPGGGYDTYGRLTAKYMGKHLRARFVVKNMPGAGHIIGANTIYAGKADGTVIGTFNTGLVYAQALGREGVKFDLDKMSWIGKAAADPRAMLIGVETGIKSVADLRSRGKGYKLAAAGVGSAAYNDTKILIDALGLAAEVIPGFSGNEGEMAIMRGEVVGTFGSYSSLKPFVDNGYGRFVFHVGGGKELTGVPDAETLAGDDDGRTLVALVAVQAGLARLTAGPPGISADRLAVLREAYMKAWSDPALIAEAKKLRIPVVPAGGEEVATRVRRALHISPKALALVRTVMDVNEKKSATVKATITIKKLQDENRFILFDLDGKEVKSKPSGSRTKMTVGGQKAKRKALKVGMKCAIEYTPDTDRNEPVTIDCK